MKDTMYAVVTELGLIECLTDNINEALERRDELKSLDINCYLYDDADDIMDAMFNTDGLNNCWFEDYNKLYPCDAGIDMKIPYAILDRYFNNAISILADLKEESLLEYGMSDNEVWDMVDAYLTKELDCSSYVLDKIWHGEYIIV